METLAFQKRKAVKTEPNENIEKHEHGNEMQFPSITIAEPVQGPFLKREFPFLKKLRKIVEDPETDSIISWSVTKESIVIWNKEAFCNTILPTYYTHRNLSSFIHQLNCYGFRKINRGGEGLEYAHEVFQGGREHLEKPIQNRYKKGGCSDNSNRINPSDLQAKIESLNGEIMELKQEKENIISSLASMKRRIEGNNEHKKQQIRVFLEKTFSSQNLFNRFTKLVRERGGIERGQTAKRQRLEVPETSNKMSSFNGVESGENREGEKAPLSNLVEDEGVLTEVVTDKTREKEQVPDLVENEGVLSEVVTDTTNEKKLVSNSVEHEGILTDVVITDETNEKEPVSNKTKEDETVSNLAEQKVDQIVKWDMNWVENWGGWDTVMMNELRIENDDRTEEELEWGEHLFFAERKF